MKKTKRILIKHDIKWYFALSFVDLAETLGVYFSDEGFHKLVKSLHDYISDKITLNNEGEISDIYVAVEQDVPIED